MNEPDHPTIGDKLLATVETAFRAFMSGKDAPPLQPGDSTQAAWERFKACLMAAAREVPPAVAASGAARTVTLYCRCTLHVRPDGSGYGVITDPRCEIHGTGVAVNPGTWVPGKASGRCPHCDSGHMEQRVVRALSGAAPAPVMICIGGCGRSEAVGS